MATILENKEATIYLAQEKLAEWAEIIVDASVRKSRIYQRKSEKVRYFLKAISYEFFLTEDEIIKILQCLNKLAELTEWPTAPVLTEQTQPDILLGVPGVPGANGADGADGSDATIDMSGDPAYDNIAVTETTINNIKTFLIGYAPYTAPTISLAISTGGLPNSGSLVQESGITLNSVPLTITINKGREDVISSTVTSDPALDAVYQPELDINNINSGNTEQNSISESNVTATTTYTVNVIDTDSRSTVVSSQTLTFVTPFLYGSSVSVLTQGTYYSNLQRIIETKGTKAVPFNDTDAYFYFLVPLSYGQLTEIKDGSGFTALGAFTLLDPAGSDVDMAVGLGTVKMLVYRTAITDIPSQTYTFYF